MSLEEYVHSHTAGHFALGVSGWIQSWATPAAMLLGGLGGKSGEGISEGAPRGGRGAYDSIPAYAKIKPSTASKVSFVDMDALDRPETVDKLVASYVIGRKMAPKAVVKRLDERILKKVTGTKRWRTKGEAPE